jgi:hypothetical protein
MLSPECRPAPPAIPHFSRDMEKSLVAAARASSPRRQARAPRLVRLAAASLAAAAVAVAAGVGIDHAVSNRPAAAIGPGSAERPVHIHAVAFSVDTTAGGTVTVTLMRDHPRSGRAASRARRSWRAGPRHGRVRLLRARSIRAGPRLLTAPASGRREHRHHHHPGSDPGRLEAKYRLLPGPGRRRHSRQHRARQRTAHLHLDTPGPARRVRGVLTGLHHITLRVTDLSRARACHAGVRG